MNRLFMSLVAVCVAVAAGGGVAWATGLTDSFVGSDGSITACI